MVGSSNRICKVDYKNIIATFMIMNLISKLNIPLTWSNPIRQFLSYMGEYFTSHVTECMNFQRQYDPGAII